MKFSRIVIVLVSTALGSGSVFADEKAEAAGEATSKADSKDAAPVDGKSDTTPAEGDTAKSADAAAQEDTRPAPTPEELAEAKKAYSQGSKLYSQEAYKGAVDQFKKAYRLSRNPLLLYNIALTLDELDDKDKALFYFGKFLDEAPEDADQRPTAKRRAKLLRRELRADEAELNNYKPVVDEFMHKVVEMAPPKTPIDITVMVPPKSGWSVVLYYRGSGDARYTSTPMRKRYNELVGRIPAAKTKGMAVQYYIEVHTKKGKRLDGSAKSSSPNVIFIEEGAKPIYYPDFLAKKEKKKSEEMFVQGDGLFDAGSTKFSYLKWSTTGASAALLGLSITSYLLAADAKSTLEAEVAASLSECGQPPCRAFSDAQRSLQNRGQNFETMYKVSLGLGIATAGVAGYLWYKDIKATRKREKNSKITAAPAIGPDYYGGAAIIEF